ncbi:hypothetical protein ACFYKX_08530 [Cytobacillus sp. FJAT-54145]|uniref:Uncharacterized protein n=1 Tax=Cytobacillus spartinae TaxID=3299023 RepID=A0ABW6K8W3_9BACI
MDSKETNLQQSMYDTNKTLNNISAQHATAGHNEANANIIQYNISTSSEYVNSLIMLYIAKLLNNISNNTSQDLTDDFTRLESLITKAIEDDQQYRNKLLHELSKNHRK